MNDALKKLAAMPWPRVLLIAAVMAGLYWQFGLEDGVTAEQFAAAESQKQQAQQSFESAQKAVADLKKFREELDSMSARFQQVVELMPADSNVSDFMLEMREQATKAGARVKKLEPLPGVTKIDFYETRKLEIALEGTYSQILTFLSNLSKLKRLVTIDKLTLTQNPVSSNGSVEDPRVGFAGTIVSYRYTGSQSTATSTAPGATPSPGGGTR